MHISCKDEILGSIPRCGTKNLLGCSQTVKALDFDSMIVGSTPTTPAKFFFAVADYKGASVA